MATRRGFLAALGPATLATVASAREAEGPAPATLLVTAPPGSAVDQWSRGFAPFLERHWPRNVLTVTGLPGEGGLAAIRALLAAPPDGRLIAAISTPLLLARAVERSQTGMLSRVAFVAAVSEEPVVLVASPARAEDLKGIRALGPLAVLGAPPAGSGGHLAARVFSRRIPMTVLPFPSAAAARQAVLAGHISCAILPLPEAIGSLREERLAAIGIAHRSRIGLAPEMPTLREQGIDLVMTIRRGFAVAAGTPPKLEEGLRQALRAAVSDPEFASWAEALGFLPAFRDRPDWEPALRRALAAYATRWEADPWVERHE